MLARKAFCPITTACCSGVSCEIVTGVALIVFFSLSAIRQGVRLQSGRMGHTGRRCLRCEPEGIAGVIPSPGEGGDASDVIPSPGAVCRGEGSLREIPRPDRKRRASE